MKRLLVIIALMLPVVALAGDLQQSGSDNADNSLSGDTCYSRPSCWDGTYWDRQACNSSTAPTYIRIVDGDGTDLVDVDGSKRIYVIDASVRPGENASDDNRGVEKVNTKAYSPTKTTTATIGTATSTIFASTDVSTYPNWCLYIKNTDGADDFTDLDIETSPDGTSWVDITQTACGDTLNDGVLCVYCVSGSAYKYVKVDAAAADANQASSDVWFVGNKG